MIFATQLSEATTCKHVLRNLTVTLACLLDTQYTQLVPEWTSITIFALHFSLSILLPLLTNRSMISASVVFLILLTNLTISIKLQMPDEIESIGSILCLLVFAIAVFTITLR